VLVEKPAAATVAEIVDLEAYAAAAGVKCVPCHNYIYEPHLWRTRQMIDEGRLVTENAAVCCALPRFATVLFVGLLVYLPPCLEVVPRHGTFFI
jgi:hypothetical protein